jgi:hypothetical protein
MKNVILPVRYTSISSQAGGHPNILGFTNRDLAIVGVDGFLLVAFLCWIIGAWARDRWL